MQTLDWIETVGAELIGVRPFAARRRKNPAYGRPTSLAHVRFALRPWEGPISSDWHEHFGKGKRQVHSLDGTEPLRSCNEVEVAKALRKARDHAFWFSGYNPALIPAIWRPWVRSLRGEAPEWLLSLDLTIRREIRSRKGGMPDVVAWNDVEPLRSALFVECKGPKEAIAEAQEDWVWAARQTGVRAGQIAVSVRPF